MDGEGSRAQERPQGGRFAVREVPSIEPDGVLGRAAECFPLGMGLDPVDLKQQTNYATKTKEDRQEFEDAEEDTVTD